MGVQVPLSAPSRPLENGPRYTAASYGVQVFEIRPGIMETDMTAGVKGKYDELIAGGLVPQMRWGAPGDVGLAVEAILKGYLPFSTGAVIPVDGGFHLRRL